MSNTLRIISGTLGSRRIKTLRNTNLKPTPEKLREKIFSWLMSDINDARCLDLFAGSGSLGIEALSNGADFCTFVEQNPNLYKNLKENTYYSPKENDYTININFFKQPHEIVFRSLTFIINIIGGKYYSPRGKKIDMIINKINNKELSKVTLGGCIIEMQHETVIISKEY